MTPRDLSPVVYRGEVTGELRESGGWLQPWFFAEDWNHAKDYARRTTPIACVIQGRRILDLTNPDTRNPDHQRLAALMLERFDDWTCRYSGEHRSFWDYLENGDLYDYEGTGSGERWHAMFRFALDEMEFDAIRVQDVTDGGEGAPRTIWVTQSRENIRHASKGETLARMLEQKLPWQEIERFIDREIPGLNARIERLRIPDPDYALPACATPLKLKPSAIKGHRTIWRALPKDADIRPGDWISLDASYAEQHLRDDSTEIKSLEHVHEQDIFWAGTDRNEFFYLPRAWRVNAFSTEEYLRQLSPTRIRLLCDGELSSITRHREAIFQIADRVLRTFDSEACGEFHGPEHWERVRIHGQAVARSLGEDPLISHIFGWVHDSQREDEGFDRFHGPRAATFIEQHRDGLFGFLDDEQVQILMNACHLHSDGHTEGHVLEMTCWDADRLDLWRVEIEPEPSLLCTSYAKRKDTIAAARHLIGVNFCDEAEEQTARSESFSWR